jgi:hypothetical protein
VSCGDINGKNVIFNVKLKLWGGTRFGLRLGFGGHGRSIKFEDRHAEQG